MPSVRLRPGAPARAAVLSLESADLSDGMFKDFFPARTNAVVTVQ